MTDRINVAELRRLLEAATPGPWRRAGLGTAAQITAVIAEYGDDWEPIAYFCDDDGDGQAAGIDNDPPFIAALRNAAPALLRVLGAAQKQAHAWGQDMEMRHRSLSQMSGEEHEEQMRRSTEFHRSQVALLNTLVDFTGGDDADA